MKIFRCFCLSVLAIVLLVWNGSAQTSAGIITTVADSNGQSGFSGDGGPATAATFNVPLGMAVDAAGNLYIADDLNFRIRKVDPSGTITTFAGNGTSGFSGDGGPATAAQLGAVFDVAVDRSGNVFIADLGNARIRKVTPDGRISTVAGTGPSQPNPAASNGDGGPATAAQFSSPDSIAVDAAGNLFIADGDNKRVRKVDSNGIITTIASGLNYPEGVAVDAGDDVFIAERDGNDVLRVSPSGLTTIYAGNGTAGFSGDGGPAASAELISPNGVAVDASGNLFITCSGILGGGAFLPITFEDHRVRKVDASGIITTYAGGAIRVKRVACNFRLARLQRLWRRNRRRR